MPVLLVRTLLPIFALSGTDRVLDPGEILASVTESVQLMTIRSVVNIDGSSSEQLISTNAQTNTNTMSAKDKRLNIFCFIIKVCYKMVLYEVGGQMLADLGF